MKYIFIVGLVVTSMSIGEMYTAPHGFLTLGIGLIIVSLFRQLDKDFS